MNILEKSLAEWDMLGVDTRNPPHPSIKPRQIFSKELWADSVMELRSSTTFISLPLEYQWERVVNLYLSKCKSLKVFPYTTSTQEAQTSNLTRDLSMCRMRAVKFIDDTELFTEHSKVIRTDVAYSIVDKGTFIRSRAYLEPLSSDTRSLFLKPISKFRFAPSGSRIGSLARSLSASHGVRVDFYLDTSYPSRPFLEMRTSSPHRVASSRVSYQSLNKLELLQLFENRVWRPLCRIHRFKGVSNFIF